MTPAIRTLERSGVSYFLKEYPHDARAPAYGLEAAEALGLAPGSVFKTLLARLDGDRFVVAIVSVDRQLDLKALARAAGARKVAMADPADAERVTGYVVGGISPLGQKRRLPTFLDERAQRLALVHISGGRRGLEIGLSHDDLVRLTQAKVADISR
ncbi:MULTISPECIES: Cys-tRNA(Pro) deacylase [Halomonadaceae]|uniref:Cys-tRNA(Pro) deacylase n=1 Tax=Halomonadaceae TaxID=28256 RepID=UPI001597AD65|nr:MULTISPECIES: Cys-tRNA(Pro) deacylase [unclassified Halomonas]QJQ96855.1 Cys-tRNA(Pro) deacylase [Halomonas sp. PA5]